MFAVAIAGGGLKRAHAGGAHGDHAPAAGAGLADAAQGLGRHDVAFGVHDVLADARDAHRLESAGAHVQGDEGAFHAHGCQTVEHGLVEMQTGGRRGHGAGLGGVDGLVAGFVPAVGAVRDVGGQGHAAVAFQEFQHGGGKVQLEQFVPAAPDLGLEGAVGQDQACARAGRLAGAHMRQGAPGFGDAFDQDLDLSAAVLAAAQPGLDDAGVVEDQQVARAQQTGQVGELTVVQAAGAVQVQQPAGVAPFGGMLGDQFGGQFVVELGNIEGVGHGWSGGPARASGKKNVWGGKNRGYFSPMRRRVDARLPGPGSGARGSPGICPFIGPAALDYADAF